MICFSYVKNCGNTHENHKREMKKILFLACCPVSLKIGKLLGMYCNFEKERIKYKVYDFTHAYTQLSPILFGKTHFLKKISMLMRILIGNRYVKIIDRLLRYEMPDLLIVGDDGGVCSSALRFCRDMKIPSIAIQVGLLTRSIRKDVISLLRARNYFPWRVISRIFDNKLIIKVAKVFGIRFPNFEWGLNGADFIFVTSTYHKELLIRRGVPKHKIVVTGYLLADEMYFLRRRFKKEDKISLMKRYGLDLKKACLLILTQPLVEDGYCSYQEYLNVVKALLEKIDISKYSIVIKIHPREKIGKYYEVIKNSRSSIKLLTDERISLLDAILMSDVCITFYSTSGIVALAIGRPLITLDVFKTSYENPFKDYALNARNLSEFENFLEYVEENKYQLPEHITKSILNKYFGKIDGKAHERAKRMLIKILKFYGSDKNDDYSSTSETF